MVTVVVLTAVGFRSKSEVSAVFRMMMGVAGVLAGGFPHVVPLPVPPNEVVLPPLHPDPARGSVGAVS